MPAAADTLLDEEETFVEIKAGTDEVEVMVTTGVDDVVEVVLVVVGFSEVLVGAVEVVDVVEVAVEDIKEVDEAEEVESTLDDTELVDETLDVVKTEAEQKGQHVFSSNT